jgi:hypothetical protein
MIGQHCYSQGLSPGKHKVLSIPCHIYGFAAIISHRRILSFASDILHATVAQPAEQPLRKRRVKGSIPFGGSFYFSTAKTPRAFRLVKLIHIASHPV